VGARAEHLEKLDQVGDIVVEPEVAGFKRHLAGVLPVGDVGIEVAREAADRVLQQRRVMARQRRGDQDLGLRIRIIDLEVKQVGERQAMDQPFLENALLAVRPAAHRVRLLGIIGEPAQRNLARRGKGAV
jgi:hypothetical protein